VIQQLKQRFTLNPHQKLCEDSCSVEPLLGDGVTFTVRHLGSCGVARPSGEEVTSQAVRRIIQQARADDRNEVGTGSKGILWHSFLLWDQII